MTRMYARERITATRTDTSLSPRGRPDFSLRGTWGKVDSPKNEEKLKISHFFFKSDYVSIKLFPASFDALSNEKFDTES